MLVAVGTATDPTRRRRRLRSHPGLLEAVRTLPGIRLSITTKGTLVTRDLDLLRAIAERSELSVNFSVTTTDAELARLLEPRAPRPDLRLAAMQRLAEAGLATRLFMMPVLLYLTDGDASIGALLQAARAAGAREAECNVLFLREGSASSSSGSSTNGSPPSSRAIERSTPRPRTSRPPSLARSRPALRAWPGRMGSPGGAGPTARRAGPARRQLALAW